MTIKKFILAALFSTLLYASLFLFVMHKPLTIGVMNDYYDKKIGYVETLRSPKLVILAGSNGRFSHRCETIELEHGISCINMSIAATISIDYQLERIKPYLGAGDMVYLPLEYGVLSKTVREMAALDDVPFTAAYDRKYFFNQPLERLLPAIFYFDLKFLISSAGEMALDRLGISRRFSSDTLTKQGDEKGHTLKKAEPYRRYLSQLEWGQPGLRAPVPEDMNVDADSARIVRDFLFYASDADITRCPNRWSTALRSFIGRPVISFWCWRVSASTRAATSTTHRIICRSLRRYGTVNWWAINWHA
jgi:hypothetical protein